MRASKFARASGDPRSFRAILKYPIFTPSPPPHRSSFTTAVAAAKPHLKSGDTKGLSRRSKEDSNSVKLIRPTNEQHARSAIPLKRRTRACECDSTGRIIAHSLKTRLSVRLLAHACTLGKPDTCPGRVVAEIRYYNPAGDRKYRRGDARQHCEAVKS